MKVQRSATPIPTRNLIGGKLRQAFAHSAWKVAFSVHFFFFIAALVAIDAQAAERRAGKLSLNDAVSEALGTSPVVGQAKAAMEEQSWKQTESLSGFLPTVQISGSHLFTKRYQYTDLVFNGSPTSIPGIIPTTSAALSASIPIFDGFANISRYRAAAQLGEAAHNDADWTNFRIEEETKLHYAEALTAVKLELVAQQNVETLTDHLDQVNKTRRGGMATQFDVLRVEVQLNEAQSELLRSKDDVVLTRQKLLLTLGREASEDNREIEGNLEVPDAQTIASLKLEDRMQRKDLAALALRSQAANLSESASAAYWIPKISLGAQYILYNNLSDGFSDWNRYREAWNTGVFMTWTLFDGMTSIARSKTSIAQRVQVEKQLESARLQAPNDFEFWKRRYLYSATLYQAKVSDVKKGEESIRLAKAAFKAGVRTNSEVLDSELDLFRARAGLVNALKNCAEAKIKLELAIGKPIATSQQPVTAQR
ncbi:MAG: TolC family protein [Cryobacterium sp.]|nr:TolC family protein [Oligoflexia bacterium]